MLNKKANLFFAGFSAFIFFLVLRGTATAAPIEPFHKDERILILAPHPDDENIGCSGVIQRALKAGARVKVAYLTNGDHNEFAFIVYEKRPVFFNREFVAMGRVREQEAKNAMKLLGLNEADLIFLGYPDYGTDTIFFSYWDAGRPFASYLTRQSYVPYKESPSFHQPYKAEVILKDIKKILLDYKPNKIFVSHPADLNGDHWAYYMFLQIALLDLRKELPQPKLYVYFVHAPGWPLPRHYHPQLNLEPSNRHFPEDLIEWSRLELTPEEINNKYQAMLCYRSQTCVSAFYLLSFVRQNELFGDYPLIELKKQYSADSTRGADFFQDDKKVSYAIVDDCFWIRVKKPPELKSRLLFRFYILGYSDKTPFAKMPNVYIRTKKDKFRIFEMNTTKEMNPKGASCELLKDFFILKVPLSTLGGPDFIFTCLVTDKPFLPLDAAGFRRIEIKD